MTTGVEENLNFAERLAGYKRAIDIDIAAYAEHTAKVTRQQYGRYPAEAEVDIFLDILSRGGKRIRGALVMAGYEMCGGTNQAMIVQAARAIEMLHAYILIIDDIQDRAALRRGKPSAHEMLAAYHRKHHLKGDAMHAGMSLALMAALTGGHAAQAILANMDADPQLRLNAISITNRTMAVTAHGQTLDIMNELVESPSAQDIDRVLELKTAQYTIINPLHVGMVLAGAGCEATDAITPYGLHVGKAFQITDDILGLYGDEQELGKVPGDDVREGKGTILTRYALQHTVPLERAFLVKCLGNSKLSAKDFDRFKQIVEDSGALAYARSRALTDVNKALKSLDACKGLWTQQGSIFLHELAVTLQDRVA
jgi:geranylgeranyl diphosphate synthase type I